MKITVNGQVLDVQVDITVTEFLAGRNVSGPVAVELNREICPKASHSETKLSDGDVLEVVTIVGGG